MTTTALIIMDFFMIFSRSFLIHLNTVVVAAADDDNDDYDLDEYYDSIISTMVTMDVRIGLH